MDLLMKYYLTIPFFSYYMTKTETKLDHFRMCHKPERIQHLQSQGGRETKNMILN